MPDNADNADNADNSTDNIHPSFRKLYSTKVCSKCKTRKELSDFSPNGKSSSGKARYRGACKQCEKIRDAARYAAKKSNQEARQ